MQKFVGEPQDHYQSTLNFHTLLLKCKGNFPSLLEMKKKNFDYPPYCVLHNTLW